MKGECGKDKVGIGFPEADRNVLSLSKFPTFAKKRTVSEAKTTAMETSWTVCASHNGV